MLTLSRKLDECKPLVDGALVGNPVKLGLGPDTITDCQLDIGGAYAQVPATVFAGLVDDVQVWGKALDACGIRHTMWVGLDRCCSHRHRMALNSTI
jgi:hypothetical protein